MSEEMIYFNLRDFTGETQFPFYIGYGNHPEDLSVHRHKDFDEMVIVLNGSAIHVVDNEEHLISRGDVFIISEDTSHGYINPKDFYICNIMYDRDFMISSKLDIAKSAGYHALFVLEPYLSKEHSFNSRLKLINEDFEKIKQLIGDMIDEFCVYKPCRDTILFSGFLYLCAFLSRHYTFNPSSQFEDNGVINLANAVSYIENHFSEELSVTKLAEMCNYSARHFIRLFSDTYKTTPLEYIINTRINYAKRCLKEGSYSVSKIAAECGFSDSNYFCRAFKRKTGLTPSQYKKQHFTK